ncbi:MAG: transglutaminase family protein [Chromatiales bacterium]|jgi:transglutaminase-like putative cysteine protease
MKRIEIQHLTRYSFNSPVRLEPHTLLLRPREGHDLRIVNSSLDIQPKATLGWRRDMYDNVLGIATFDSEPTNNLVILSRVEVELYETMPLNFLVERHALLFPFNYRPDERTALAAYLEPTYAADAGLTNWLENYRQSPRDTETFTVLDRMNRQINHEIAYAAREREGVQSPAETLGLVTGSCRDLATLFMEACRRLGIAARFVSGYVHDPASESGGAATHAWSEVYLPGAGWKGFDPTNATVVGPDHIPVAVHRHPEAVSPVAGSFIGAKDLNSNLSVDVKIHQLETTA